MLWNWEHQGKVKVNSGNFFLTPAQSDTKLLVFLCPKNKDKSLLQDWKKIYFMLEFTFVLFSFSSFTPLYFGQYVLFYVHVSSAVSRMQTSPKYHSQASKLTLAGSNFASGLHQTGSAKLYDTHILRHSLGETLTMVAWLTMVNHGWTMVDNG